ncbi:MAG: EamA family transporter RarD [Rhodobacteraceae bacterium]|nr:EamA family transporter RarD [Paracoccaceae bacterium]
MTKTPAPANTAEDTLPGFFFALSAYGLWGLLPLYMKALASVPASEVVVHRVLWSLPVALLVLAATGRGADLMRALKSPRMILMAMLTALLISTNWGIYVWAIGAGHALDTALGYYINPLFSIFLGAVLLREKLMALQWAAIGLAGGAVLILTVVAGQVPVVAISLTLTFGFYAFFKKSLPIGPNQGFTLEVLILMPFAIAYYIYLVRQGESHFMAGDAGITALLLGCGPVTAIPLMLYANGAKRLRLTTIAIMQYIAPSMIFLTAVLLFGEPFGTARAVAFPMIWAALVLYSWSLFRQSKRPGR